MVKQSYARVMRSIWSDPDFRGLSPVAQWVYFAVLTSPGTTLAGVADWRPSRLAAYAVGLPCDAVEMAGEELSEARFFCIDADTEEALIRTFVRYDGMLKQPNMAIALAKEYPKIASEQLRGVLVWELKRLKRDEPDLYWKPLVDVLHRPAVNPKGSGNPSPNPSGNPSLWASPKGTPNPSDDPSPTPDSRLQTPISLPSSLRSVTPGRASAPDVPGETPTRMMPGGAR